jgi:hypothetical protein
MKTNNKKQVESIDSLAFSSTMRRRHEVAYLVEALSYKPEGRGFDSR